MIVYSTTDGLTAWKGKTSEIDEAVTKLAGIGKFAQYTRYTEPAGAGAQATLWKRGGKGESLRLDFQRVFSTAEPKVVKTVQYKFLKKTYATYDEAKAVAKKKVADITEESVTKTTYDTNKIWSLFAVQEAGTYNQVFVLNNPTFNPSAADWVSYFSTSLSTGFAAILTTVKDNLPSGFSVHELITGMGDLPAE